METSYLAHYGILGQKWGIRRFQNADGTYTSEGKRRRNGDWFDPKIKVGKDKSPVSKAENLTKGAQKITENSSKIYSTASKVKNRKAEQERQEKLNRKISKMSDDDLRKAVNRMNLEKQYKDAIRTKETDNGRISAGEVLETVGAVVGIAAGVATIITTIHRD